MPTTTPPTAPIGHERPPDWLFWNCPAQAQSGHCENGLCGDQVRQRNEILLDLDSTDDSTHGQQQLSLFNGSYGQHMYHPLLVFETPHRMPAGSA
jgi:hypothetical protein